RFRRLPSDCASSGELEYRIPGAVQLPSAARNSVELHRQSLKDFREIKRHDDVSIARGNHNFLMRRVDADSIYIQAGEVPYWNLPAWGHVSLVLDVPDAD